MENQDKKTLKKTILMEIVIALIVVALVFGSWIGYLEWNSTRVYLCHISGAWASEEGDFTLRTVRDEQNDLKFLAVFTKEGKEYICEVWTNKGLAWFVDKNKKEELQQDTQRYPDQKVPYSDYAVWDAEVTVKDKGNVLKVEIIKDYVSGAEGEVIVLYRQ